MAVLNRCECDRQRIASLTIQYIQLKVDMIIDAGSDTVVNSAQKSKRAVFGSVQSVLDCLELAGMADLLLSKLACAG